MDRKAPVILGLTVAGIGIALIVRKAVAEPPCMDIEPGSFYYFTYIGGRKTIMEALGECYPVIYTIEIYDEETGDWWPPTDPGYDILETGMYCRVMVQAPCKLCNFEPS